MRRNCHLCCFLASLPLLLLPLPAADPAAPAHAEYRRAAEVAYLKKDFVGAREAYTAALALRPDSPRYLHSLAATQALTGLPDAALATLRRLTALGIATAIERDADFASLQGLAGFNAIRSALATNREPHGEADLLAELPGRTGILEGLAYHASTGDLYLGDVHHRCIWRRDRDGRVTRYTAEEGDLLGVFGLALEEPRRALWAATTAVPEMSGYTPDLKGHAALVEFNLVTSEQRRVVDLPTDNRPHVLGDLVVAPDGVIYVTDSASPIIWRYTPGDEELENFIENPAFGSLQGIVLSDRTLIVSDYTNGLFTVDLTASPPLVRTLAPPPATTLLGLDGLVLAPGGVIAVQNGVSPQRVVRLTLNGDLTAVTGLTVLASALPRMEDLALVTLVNGLPTFIANAGWDTFDPAKSAHPPAHQVLIFQSSSP